jgi:hypothetical protein
MTVGSETTPVDSADLPRILSETERRIKTSARAHWETTNRLENCGRLVTTLTIGGGFAVSLLGAVPIVTPALYVPHALWINLAIFVLAGATSILSTFQAVFRWSERGQAHRIAASQYTNARRKLEVLLLKTPINTDDFRELLEYLTQLSDTTPSVPEPIWLKATAYIKRNP